MTDRLLKRWLVVLAVVAPTGCSGPDDLVVPGARHQLEKVAGDSQSLAPLSLSAPLTVRVVDRSGVPVPDVEVEFALDSGAGAVTAAVDTSDADGLARTTFQATTRAGPRILTARRGGERIRFRLVVRPGESDGIFNVYGWDQRGPAGSVLPEPVGLRVRDQWNNSIPGRVVTWKVRGDGGAVSSDLTVTDSAGIARIVRTLGPEGGGQVTEAVIVSLNDTVLFHSTAVGAMTILGGGHNLPGRCSGRVWAHGDHAYGASWSLDAPCPHAGAGPGAWIHVWDLRGGPQLVDSIALPGGDVSDVEVSADGTLLVATVQHSVDADGLYLYSLADPAHPAFLESYPGQDSSAPSGPLRAATFAEVGGQRYVFAARGPGAAPPAMVTYRIEPQATRKIVQVGEKPLGPNTTIVDQVVREGIAYASLGAAGVRVYDVGGGLQGGSPELPFTLLTITPSGESSGALALYDHPDRAKRFLFDVQRTPTVNQVRVIDVSDPQDPFYGASIPLGPEVVRRLWVDEEDGILYVSHVDGAVVAYDVRGQLSGALTRREVARIQPNGGATDVWGMAFANGALWVSDKLSGLWRVSTP
jgi:hypothetical protein